MDNDDEGCPSMANIKMVAEAITNITKRDRDLINQAEKENKMAQVDSFTELATQQVLEKQAQVNFERSRKQALARRFQELVVKVLHSVHFHNDGYGPLSVEEDSKTVEFKAKIQAICKEYL